MVRLYPSCQFISIFYSSFNYYFYFSTLHAEVEYGRVTWAGWQASERGSRGENCGFLHLELTKSSSPDDGDRSTKGQRGKKKTKSSGGGDSVDDLARHTFAHFVAGGPRTARNPRLRAIVADVGRLSAVALATVATGSTDATTTTPPTTTSAPAAASSSTVIAASSPSPRARRTRSTVVIGSDGEDDRVEEEEIVEEEEEEVSDKEDEDDDHEAGIRVERIGHRGTEAMHGVVRGGAGMCRVHLTPTAIVQLDRRYRPPEHHTHRVLPAANVQPITMCGAARSWWCRIARLKWRAWSVHSSVRPASLCVCVCVCDLMSHIRFVYRTCVAQL
jgi:hypothetical protein